MTQPNRPPGAGGWWRGLGAALAVAALAVAALMWVARPVVAAGWTVRLPEG